MMTPNLTQQPTGYDQPRGYDVPINAGGGKRLPITVNDNGTSWILDLDGRPVVQPVEDVQHLRAQTYVL